MPLIQADRHTALVLCSEAGGFQSCKLWAWEYLSLDEKRKKKVSSRSRKSVKERKMKKALDGPKLRSVNMKWAKI